MASRYPRNSPFFLPFLYPSLFFAKPSNGLTCLSRAGGVRRHSSLPPGADASPSSSRLNPAPDDYNTPSFADKAQLTLHAGPGGHGCISFLREAYMPDGPANGGDGGHGGNVYIQAAHGETSLHKLARRRVIRASRGKHGRGSAQGGQRGDDVIITVPVGTVVRELSREDPVAEEQMAARLRKAQLKQRREEQRQRERMGSGAASSVSDPEEGELDDPDRHKWLLYPGLSKTDVASVIFPRLPRRERLFMQPPGPMHLDLSRPTPQPILLAAGGIGGLGNPHFVSRENPKPTFATKGEPAVSMTIELELKLLADVGLVGLPNAGKSTLLRAISNSRTRIGNWAFTTLQPNIGTVVLDNYSGRSVIRSYKKTATSPLSGSEWDGAVQPEAEVEQRTRFTIADIPGLIEGAHLDRGLGIAFLRHVERAGVLAFVIDLSAGDAVAALEALWNEVGLYAQMREDEERSLEVDTRVDWDPSPDAVRRDRSGMAVQGSLMYMDMPAAPASNTGLHIAAKPWFVVATKGDLPETEENFRQLQAYLDAVTMGERPHPSGMENAWTENCAAIPVSAINGQGVDRVVHWVVGLLDGTE